MRSSDVHVSHTKDITFGIATLERHVNQSGDLVVNTRSESEDVAMVGSGDLILCTNDEPENHDNANKWNPNV